MKCLILAAGYATRLYPLTKDFPKPLLTVGGKTILDWLVDDLAGLASEFWVVSNHKFAPHFHAWAEKKALPVVVLDDGTQREEARLGAVRDIQFAVEQLGLEEDVLVLAGDNVLSFHCGELVRYAEGKQTSCVFRYWEPEEKRLCRSGVLELGEDERVLSMEEKPAHPRSHWCCPPFYYYRREDLALLPQALDAGCGADAPGSFLSWLCRQVPVHAMEMPGRRYDIGTVENYREVNEIYRGFSEEP